MYDKQGNIIELVNKDVNRDVLSSFIYTYDPSGRIVKEVATQKDKVYTRSFNYNLAGELEKFVEVENDGQTTTYTYSYDQSGNRLKLVEHRESVDGDSPPDHVTTYKYNNANQLIEENSKKNGRITYTYDANGNLMKKSGKKLAQTYTYTVENRLKAVQNEGVLLLAVTYDGDGNRMFQMSRKDYQGYANPDKSTDSEKDKEGTDGSCENSSKGNNGNHYGSDNGNKGNNQGDNGQHKGQNKDACGNDKGNNGKHNGADNGHNDNGNNGNHNGSDNGNNGNHNGSDNGNQNGSDNGNSGSGNGGNSNQGGGSNGNSEGNPPANSNGNGNNTAHSQQAEKQAVKFSNQKGKGNTAESSGTAITNQPSSETSPLTTEDTAIVFPDNNTSNIDNNQYDLTYYVNDVNREYTQQLMTYDGEGNLKDAYVYGNEDERLTRDHIQNDNQTQSGHRSLDTYLYDGRGSVTQVTNEESQIIGNQQYRYDPFGNMIENKPFKEIIFGYNGEEFDPTTDTQYLRARHYDVGMSRFISKDTYFGETKNPLSRNLYAYTANDRVNYKDPSGHVLIYLTKLNQNPEDLKSNDKSKEQLKNMAGISWMDFIDENEHRWRSEFEDLVILTSTGQL